METISYRGRIGVGKGGRGPKTVQGGCWRKTAWKKTEGEFWIEHFESVSPRQLPTLPRKDRTHNILGNSETPWRRKSR